MIIPCNITTNSVEETESLGARLATALAEDNSLPRFVALYGDLGVGKTAFVRGFTSVFSPKARVKSPTFALVNEYKGQGGASVFHFDMYRIENEDELYSVGFYDYLDRDGVCLTEWSENIPFALPDKHIAVNIEKCPEEHPDRRRITINLLQSER